MPNYSGSWNLVQQMQAVAVGNWQFSAVTPGTVAIFTLGYTAACTFTTLRNKYTFTGCVNSSATAANRAGRGGSAVGNSTVAIFNIGQNCVGTSARDKYLYAGDLSLVGTSPSSVYSQFGSGTSTSTFGIFAGIQTNGGSPAATTNKYTFSGCVNTTATNLLSSNQFGSAVGNSTKGIFALGYDCTSTASTTRNKYTYSGCVVASATAASNASYGSSAVGNSTIGIFALGRVCGVGASTTRNKYTFASCTNGSATAASNASLEGSAAGNSTVGIFALGFAPGFSTIRDKYTFSGCVVTSGASASVGSAYGSAASNGTCGVNI